MYLPTKQSELMGDLALKVQNLTQLLCKELAASGSVFTIAPCLDIFAELPPTQLLRIDSGAVEYRVNGKLILQFEEGDLLGLARSLSLPVGQFSCRADIHVQAHERDSLIAHVNSDLSLQRNWAHYLLCNQSFYELALSQELRGEFQPAAGFLHFRAGDTIIQQGKSADRVYTLLEGSAIAECDGVKVGDIHTNEIFGALAVFTRQPRMASVIATSDCTVLAVRKEEFVEMIDYQPHICLGLIEDMATKINELNNQLLQLKASAA
jgi:CRP/FNR family transcriptional regulator, cyclic AMP receptor protein